MLAFVDVKRGSLWRLSASAVRKILPTLRLVGIKGYERNFRAATPCSRRKAAEGWRLLHEPNSAYHGCEGPLTLVQPLISDSRKFPQTRPFAIRCELSPGAGQLELAERVGWHPSAVGRLARRLGLLQPWLPWFGRFDRGRRLTP
jgi:hypothetical protein